MNSPDPAPAPRDPRTTSLALLVLAGVVLSSIALTWSNLRSDAPAEKVPEFAAAPDLIPRGPDPAAELRARLARPPLTSPSAPVPALAPTLALAPPAAARARTRYTLGSGGPALPPRPAAAEPALPVAAVAPEDQPVMPFVPAGTVIPVRLDTALDSDYRQSVARGLVTANIYDATGVHLMIPAGSRVLGAPFAAAVANVPIRRRLGFAIEAIVRSDGSVISLQADALDEAGAPALAGDVDHHTWTRLGGLTAYALLGLAPALAADNGAAQSSRDEATRDLTSGLQQAGRAFAEPYVSLLPTITIPPGTQLRILLRQPLSVSPMQT